MGVGPAITSSFGNPVANSEWSLFGEEQLKKQYTIFGIGTLRQSSKQSPAPTDLYLFDRLVELDSWSTVIGFENGKLETVKRERSYEWKQLVRQFKEGAVDA